ncbi:MAG TPA: HAMP domain-containing sensor histidine kinase [Acidimicrobiales bacterium]|nr:HAMP domain-containing sensor histidine kinase [Acidimicrobiales bacterium]
MTLRTRVTLAAGGAVLLAVVAVSVTVFLVVRGNLRDQVDDSLRDHVGRQHEVPTTESEAAHIPLLEDVFMQVVDGNGQVVATFDERPLPVTPAVRAVARGERAEAWFDARIGGTPVRIAVTSPQPGVAFELGRSLAEVDEALRKLLVALTVISVAAVSLAALIGRLVAAAAAAPVHRVAGAAETVARTGDLSHHLDVPSGDDLGRLAASFNTMLDALNESLARQRRLVADASHELRTPLATVRTNVEVLARADELGPGEREAVIGDTVAQIDELTRLVGDLVELARGDGEGEPFTTIDLGELARSAVTLVGRNYPDVTFQLGGSRTAVRGAAGRVGRAVANLVDNAGKWSPPGGTVEIVVGNGAVVVRDHGPGVDPDDLPRIFDRFYRSPAARTRPGSGLGLAIAKQVADSHGGTITAEAAPGGGARFVLRLPTVEGHPGGPEVPTELSSSS